MSESIYEHDEKENILCIFIEHLIAPWALYTRGMLIFATRTVRFALPLIGY